MSGVRTVLLKDICNFEKGLTGLMKAEPGKYPLVTTGKDNRSCESYQFDTKAVCIPLVSSTGHGHASLNNVHYQEGKFALGTILVGITAKNENEIDMHFLHLYLFQLKDVVLVPLMKGAANVSLSITAIKGIEIPLPSISRQREIIDKFKSIVREEAEIIDELSLQKSLVKKLRKQVYQDAIEGKLTAKWREENNLNNTSKDLIKKISLDKEKLIKEKVIKRQDSVTDDNEFVEPYQTPESWSWERLGFLINIKSGKRVHASDYREKGVPFLRSGEIGSLGRGEKIKQELFISEDKYSEIKARFGIPKTSDILIACIGGSIGNTWVVDDRQFYYKDGNLVLLESIPEIDTNYLLIYLSCPFFWNNTILNATDSSYNALTIVKLNKALFPLPPFEEQKAIVGKVQTLNALMDQLEMKIGEDKKHAEILIRTVLREEFSAKDSSNVINNK